jgi:hypothetical protein
VLSDRCWYEVKQRECHGVRRKKERWDMGTVRNRELRRCDTRTIPSIFTGLCLFKRSSRTTRGGKKITLDIEHLIPRNTNSSTALQHHISPRLHLSPHTRHPPPTSHSHKKRRILTRSQNPRLPILTHNNIAPPSSPSCPGTLNSTLAVYAT